MRGQPLILASSGPLLFGGLLEGRALVLRQALPALTGGALTAIGAAALALGLWRIVRYRRAHPWTDG